ncbi:MAG: hypothetical protein EP330_18425 [Deltaproteobacteria bacterium]|nr:MAG: hypothetical protein EP330_18425 [Deltaproteobacteria bacterium]
MFRALVAIDQALGATRPGWRWIGEVSLVLLGVHLAADRLDDAVLGFLASMGWLGPDGTPVAAYLAVGLELLVAARVAAILLLSVGAPPATWAHFKANWSIEGVVRPLFWVPTAAAGAWVLGMAVEDALSPYLGEPAFWLGVIAALIAGWRLGITALGRLIGGLFPPKRRTDGWMWALPLLLTASLAARYGLPVWGWL